MACPMCPEGFDTVWEPLNDTIVRRCVFAPVDPALADQILSMQVSGVLLISFFLGFLWFVRAKPLYRRRILSNGTVHLEEV